METEFLFLGGKMVLALVIHQREVAFQNWNVLIYLFEKLIKLIDIYNYRDFILPPSLWLPYAPISTAVKQYLASQAASKTMLK